ncbi:MAG: hypothetical protein GQ531_08770 [Sulfurovum sp.]|nr:hypothetical protein [Sulfurovum sp.]
MDNSENLFDINTLLKTLTVHLRHVAEEKHIDLIYDMHTSIPRELRGDNVVLERLLTTLLTFIYKHTDRPELLLTLDATEDFLYEEDISFILEKTNIDKDQILAFLETGLGKDLDSLNGKIVYEPGMDVHLKIPFKIGELGFRRHYRLPFTAMLKKKVLLVIDSENLTTSIANMFKYFQYEVDIGSQKEALDLLAYDLVIIEDCLVFESFVDLMKKAQKKKDVKCVLIGEDGKQDCACGNALSMHLNKPVTQESIFELIISLFDHVSPLENDVEPFEDLPEESSELLDIKALFAAHEHHDKEDVVVHQLDSLIESKQSADVQVLNIDLGLVNAKKMGLNYKVELKNFLDIFDHSDIYFRQIVGEVSTYKIKEFCIDLEQKSKAIGAESMSNFADVVSLIFVYDKLDLLPIYPGRYHIELQKLVIEIGRYLDK